MTAVGATNVGSISLTFDQAFRTNKWLRGSFGSFDEKCLVTDSGVQTKSIEREISIKSELNDGPIILHETVYPEQELNKGLVMRKGDELGQFNLGSTVVLVFEAPESFRFCVEPHQKIELGQPLGSIAPPIEVEGSWSKQSHPPLKTLTDVETHMAPDDDKLL
jgi:phosphatidylserine decarboxylase